MSGTTTTSAAALTNTTSVVEGNDGMFREIDDNMAALQANIKKAMAVLNKQREDLNRERSTFEEMKSKIATVHFASTIKLDVGGRVFKTSRGTLTKEPSMLATMFSGNGIPVEKDEDGGYFIDRSSTHFDTILNYLRTGVFLAPSDPVAMEELKMEVDFYQIRSLVKLLSKKTFKWSSPTDKDGIFYWIGCEKGSTTYSDPTTTRPNLVKVDQSPGARQTLLHPEHGSGDVSCSDARNKYFTAIFTNKWLLCPNYYSLSYNTGCHRPSNWTLSASIDGQNWEVISNHTNDTALHSQNRASWPIKTTHKFNQFRVTCTGNDQASGGCYCFHVSGLELYGALEGPDCSN
ncbi:K+ channel tetramerization subfamily protein [Pelomyxa schiedti]|nr:K+ channel tetramerization subfamily protein [Pelomyxa schiedti]